MDSVLRKIFKNNLKIRKGEKVLVLTDIHKKPTRKQLDINKIAEKAAEIAKEFTKNVFLIKYPAVGRHSGPLPPSVESAMIQADVIFAPTFYSATHASATQKASKRGARIITLPRVEKSMFEKDGPIDINHKKMATEMKKLMKKFKGVDKVRVVAEQTDLEFSIKGRRMDMNDGIMKKGSLDNLPAGEFAFAPIENSANGYISFTYPKAKMIFEEGKVVKFKGPVKMKKQIMAKAHRRTIAELGIGANPKARNPKNVLEAEKIKGTIHIAVGNSTSLGGKNKSDIHEDFILFEPTVIVDGKKIIDKGKWLI
jgi:leucyl aminopeptidase (aminopeptidase T)